MMMAAAPAAAASHRGTVGLVGLGEATIVVDDHDQHDDEGAAWAALAAADRTAGKARELANDPASAETSRRGDIGNDEKDGEEEAGDGSSRSSADDGFDAFTRDLSALIGALSRSTTMEVAEEESGSQRGARARDHQPQRRRRRRNPGPQRPPPLALLAAALHGPNNDDGSGSISSSRRAGAMGRGPRRCVGPCCVVPRGRNSSNNQRLAPMPDPSRGDDEGNAPAAPLRDEVDASAPARRAIEAELRLPPSQQRCFEVHDPAFDAAALLISGTSAKCMARRRQGDRGQG